MPSGGIHLCVAMSVSKKLGMDCSMNFLVGNIAPDSWRNSTSTKSGTHFIDSPTSLDYDCDFFYEKYHKYLNNDFVFGYLVHLLTDKYWHGNNFISSKIFGSERDELSKACSELVRIYKVPKLELTSDFSNPVEELETSGIEKTINYLNSVNYLEDANSSFDVLELASCVEETSSFIIGELDRLKKPNKEMKN